MKSKSKKNRAYPAANFGHRVRLDHTGGRRLVNAPGVSGVRGADAFPGRVVHGDLGDLCDRSGRSRYSTHWSLFGKIVIISLIQVGGLGFMTMATLFAFALNKRLSLKERLILQEAMNQGSMEGIVRLIRKVLVYSLTIEFTAAVIFAIRWSFDLGPVRALGYGVFHAISFFNNAGFDLFGPITGQFSSITAYADDYVINIVSMALIILGGIGFVVLSDLMEYKQRRRLSLHSKVVLSASGILILVGAIVIFIFEFTNPKTLATLNWNGKILASFFQSVSPRTAGANSIDIAGMRQATQFFHYCSHVHRGVPGIDGWRDQDDDVHDADRGDYRDDPGERGYRAVP